MSKDLKKGVIKALLQGQVSNVEAKALVRSNGKIILDLSTGVVETDKVQVDTLERLPFLKPYFQYIINLGSGVKP